MDGSRRRGRGRRSVIGRALLLRRLAEQRAMLGELRDEMRALGDAVMNLAEPVRSGLPDLPRDEGSEVLTPVSDATNSLGNSPRLPRTVH